MPSRTSKASRPHHGRGTHLRRGTRLDQLLVDRGLAESLAKAQAIIMAGLVEIPGVERPKAGMAFPDDAALTIRETMPWVSRGGLKLDFAIKAFGLDHAVRGTWLDSGSSTGGFTQVLLAHGAARVFAVDVGYGQLDVRLREDARVIVREKINVRLLTRAQVPDDLDGITLDLSFISSRVVLPVLVPWLKPHAPVLLLFKPQFEGEPRDLAKGGVVRDEAVRERILADWEIWATGHDWEIRDRIESPVRGQSGNVEYLLRLESRHA